MNMKEEKKDYKKLYLDELKDRRFTDSVVYAMGGCFTFAMCTSFVTENAIALIIMSILGLATGFVWKWRTINKEIQDS